MINNDTPVRAHLTHLAYLAEVGANIYNSFSAYGTEPGEDERAIEAAVSEDEKEPSK